MRRLARALAVVAALGTGAAIGVATRSRGRIAASARPPDVERVVRALDRWNAAAPAELTAALEAVGPPSRLASPWREEVELAGIVLAADPAALEAFARGTPDVPARARAWLRLMNDPRGALTRAAALRELRARHPDSAAATVFGARAGAPTK